MPRKRYFQKEYVKKGQSSLATTHYISHNLYESKACKYLDIWGVRVVHEPILHIYPNQPTAYSSKYLHLILLRYFTYCPIYIAIK